MLEFKVIENLKLNKYLTNILKSFKYKINKISDIFIYKAIQSITWLSSKILFIYYFLWINTSI